jgi:hypothetical protein
MKALSSRSSPRAKGTGEKEWTVVYGAIEHCLVGKLIFALGEVASNLLRSIESKKGRCQSSAAPLCLLPFDELLTASTFSEELVTQRALQHYNVQTISWCVLI